MAENINNKQGWIKLYRQIQNNEFWLSEKFTKAQAWVDLLLLANHKASTFFIRGIEFNLYKGQLAYSQLSLSIRWGWNERTVKRYLKMLENRGMIQTKINNVTTVITIQNYKDYQDNTEQTTDQTTEQKQTKIQTNKNDKNDKDNNIQARNDRNYLLQVPLTDLQVFTKTYRVTEVQVKEKAEELFHYCISKGKSYKNYRSFLTNALFRQYGKRNTEYSEAGFRIVR